MAAKKMQDIREKVVRQALELGARQGWNALSLADIAAAAGISLAELHDHFEDKTDILVAFGRMLDRRVLENIGEPETGTSVKDRLFDILMERYELLNEDREGIVAVLDSFCPDPKQAVISLPHLCRSMTWMMEAAGVDTGGITGALKVTGLTGIYLKGLRVWKEDESPDLAKTMATLDKDLGRADKLAGMLGF